VQAENKKHSPPDTSGATKQAQADGANVSTPREQLVRSLVSASATGGKFWKIQLDGLSATTVTFGKLRSNGQSTKRNHGSTDAAIAFMNVQVHEKMAKGYVEAPSSAQKCRQAGKTDSASPKIAAPEQGQVGVTTTLEGKMERDPSIDTQATQGYEEANPPQEKLRNTSACVHVEEVCDDSESQTQGYTEAAAKKKRPPVAAMDGVGECDKPALRPKRKRDQTRQPRAVVKKNDGNQELTVIKPQIEVGQSRARKGRAGGRNIASRKAGGKKVQSLPEKVTKKTASSRTEKGEKAREKSGQDILQTWAKLSEDADLSTIVDDSDLTTIINDFVRLPDYASIATINELSALGYKMGACVKSVLTNHNIDLVGSIFCFAFIAFFSIIVFIHCVFVCQAANWLFEGGGDASLTKVKRFSLV
jgi:predicted DNA-binding WGR domain protein